MRGNRQNHFRRHPLGLERTQQIAQERDVTEPGNRHLGPTIFFLKKSSQDDGLAVAHIQHRLGGPVAELELRDRGRLLQQDDIAQANYLDLHFQREFIRQVDVRLNRQFDAGVAKLDRCDG